MLKQITLKKLPEATAQEVFDFITNHLLTQKEQAVGPDGVCRYRIEKGNKVLKCAAGCLISDEEYDISFEDCLWETLVWNKNITKKHFKLITILQRMHDCFDSDTDNWKKELKKIAENQGLQFNYKE